MSAATTATPHAAAPPPERKKRLGEQAVRIMTTTDHKLIGKMYLITSFAWFIVAGLMAMLIRSELAYPGQQIVNDELYNQLFTMHGTIMLLLFATPLFFGFANVIMPLQIGAPDVAFPRLNMFSYWLFLFGGLIAASGFLTPSGAADFGWFAYTPLSDAVRSPGVGGDLWIMGLWMAGLGTILGARQLHHHDHLHARARHDDVPDADLRVEHAGHQPARDHRVPDPRGRPALAGGGPDPRCPRVRPVARRPGPVAAPVLVLRPPGGLHHRACRSSAS